MGRLTGAGIKYQDIGSHKVRWTNMPPKSWKPQRAAPRSSPGIAGAGHRIVLGRRSAQAARLRAAGRGIQSVRLLTNRRSRHHDRARPGTRSPRSAFRYAHPILDDNSTIAAGAEAFPFGNSLEWWGADEGRNGVERRGCVLAFGFT